MKCPICDGDGVITFSKMDKNGYFNDAFFMKECSVCHGTGEVQTNEERFCGLTTEEKAKVLHKLYWEIQNHLDYNPDEDDYVEEYCLYWLKKEIHK